MKPKISHSKSFPRNAATQITTMSPGGAAKKQGGRADRIQGKSARRTSLGWHKDVEGLMVSVQRAWAAAERMRLALEKHEPETGEAEEQR
jgi:hypothetical protein